MLLEFTGQFDFCPNQKHESVVNVLRNNRIMNMLKNEMFNFLRAQIFLLKSLLKIEISKFAIWINMIKGQEVKASTNTGEEQENTSWQIETGWKLSLYFFWRTINCPQVHPDLLIFWQRSIHICRIQSYSPWFIFLT